MSLKQLDNVQRILFLKEFVSEIVINSAEDEILKKRIKEEKLKRKLGQEGPELDKYVILEPKKHTTKPAPPLENEIFASNEASSSFEKSLSTPVQKPIIHRRPLPKKIIHKPTFASQVRPISPLEQIKPIMPTQQYEQQPATQTTTTVDSLKKLDHLIRDKSVQTIECPGPGKNILVKVRNRINATNITLTEVEIKNIIIYFSNAAKIPVLSGILKASSGPLLISAIESDYAGSRFIINKKSPYSLIEGINF